MAKGENEGNGSKGFNKRDGYLLDTYACAVVSANEGDRPMANSGMGLLYQRLDMQEDPVVAMTLNEDMMARVAIAKYNAEMADYEGSRENAPKPSIDPVLLASRQKIGMATNHYGTKFGEGVGRLVIGGNKGLMAHLSRDDGKLIVVMPEDLEKKLRSDNTLVGEATGLVAAAVNELVTYKVGGQTHQMVAGYHAGRQLAAINEAMKKGQEKSKE